MIPINVKVFKLIVGSIYILLGSSLSSPIQSQVTAELSRLNIYPGAVGFLLMLAGIAIFQLDSGKFFIILSLPFCLYLFAGVTLFLSTSTVQPLIIVLGLYAFIFYIGLRWR